MNMELNQTVECTFFASAFNVNDLQITTLDQYIDQIRSKKYASAITRLRAEYLAGHTEEGDKRKKKLPLLVAGGIMKGGRKREHLVHYSRCIIVDIDGVPTSAEDILRRAEGLPYVKAGHISASGKGDKLFVLVDSDLDLHLPAFEAVCRKLENDLPGIMVDYCGKDPNRGCFVSYDPTAFYKEKSEVVPVKVEAPPASQKHVTASAIPSSDGALGNYMDKFETDNSFSSGNRHTFVMKLSGALNAAGFEESEVKRECLSRYVEPGFTEKEVAGIVSDIYTRYRSSHGSNLYCPPEHRKPHQKLKSPKSLPDRPDSEETDEFENEGVDIEPDVTLLPPFREEFFQSLPSLIRDILTYARDDTERSVLLLSSLAMLSSVTPHVQGSFARKEYQAPFYGVVIGESGSGKGCVASLFKLIASWQRYVYDNSRCEVKEYLKKKEEYELYQKLLLRSGGKKPAGLAPENPEPIKQMNLNISGYTSLARMIEQLETNSHYASCLFETEMEAVTNTLFQEYGNYGYLLNQAAHHERIGNSTKTNGSLLASYPLLSMLLTGTPEMFRRLVPSAESGLFSRLMVYKIAGHGEYRPLTSEDDTPAAAHYFDSLAERVLDIGVHLDKHPTWVHFSDTQRKRLNRYFKQEYNNVRVFGHEDVASAVLRYRLAIFRIGMVLTAIRKGEALSEEKDWVIRDDDFEVAFHIGTICLQHTYVVSTSLKRNKKELRYKMPFTSQKIFAEMPLKFKRAEIRDAGHVLLLSKSSVDRLLTSAEKNGLIISLGAGYFHKTTKGREITVPIIP